MKWISIVMKWTLIAMSTAYGYECVSVLPPQFARIEVIAKDFTGASLKNPKTELIEIGSKKEFDITKPIPYGIYALRVRIPGFKEFRREINIEQPVLLVRAVLSIGGECEGFSSLSGKIKSAPTGHELWVKFVPVLGVGGAETRVESSGAFIVGGLELGNYLLIVLDGDRAIHTETILVAGNKPLSIALN